MSGTIPVAVELPLHVALVARDAVAGQLQLVRVRATLDRRWQPEAARLEAAHVVLTRTIDTALAGAGDSTP